MVMLASSLSVQATDIAGVQWFAIDQPQVDVTLYAPGPGGDGTTPLTGTDPFGDPTTRFSAFLDTGASGIVFSELTANNFGVGRQTDGAGNRVTFGDVGVAGSALFNVSTPIDLSLTRYVSPLLGGNGAATTPMAAVIGARAQIGPLGAAPGAELPGIPGEIVDTGGLLGLLSDINIVGMPAIQSRVMVMAPPTAADPLQSLTDGLGTWLYTPGTPFTGTSADPGIPSVGRHVQLSFADFDRFNQLTPGTAERPTAAANPMIGSNTLTDPAKDSPGVVLRYGGATATGSFLLDTGAQSSFISTAMAALLGVRNKRSANGELLPELEALDASGNFVDIEEFVTDVGGIGGSTRVAGFNLSSLLLRTVEGDPANEDDPNHLRFLDAPVFVLDISVGEGDSRFTLDGVLGMNYLVASILFDLEAFSQSGSFTDLFGEFRAGAFDWLVIDTVNGRLGLNLTAAAVPLPGGAPLMVGAVLALATLLGRRPASHRRGDGPPLRGT